MVYDEVDNLPLHVTIDKRPMSFWLRLLNKKESCLTHIVYMITHNCLFVMYIQLSGYIKSRILLIIVVIYP